VAVNSYVYFIYSGSGVKIGVSKHPKERVKQIRVGAPNAILLGAVKGGLDKEAEMHQRFVNWRFGGEWFRHECLHYVAEVIAAEGVEEMFPVGPVADDGALGVTSLVDSWSSLSPDVQDYISTLCKRVIDKQAAKKNQQVQTEKTNVT
jgi:hypothetical protein